MHLLWIIAALNASCSCGSAEGAQGDGERRADAPEVFGNRRTHMDLREHASLADIHHDGLYIDFGTASRFKYTLGNWKTGWGGDESQNGATFSQVVQPAARVYFPLDQAGPVTLRFRAKPERSRNMMVFLNNRSLPSVQLQAGSDFREYDVTVPAEATRVGDNHLLLRFTGFTAAPNAAAISMDSLRVIPGATPPAPGAQYSAPALSEIVTEMQVGNMQRRSIAVRAPTTLSYYVEVPRGGSIGFGVGANGQVRATAKVVVTPNGGQPTEVFSSAVSTEEWTDRVVSLEQFAGQVVRLDLRVEGTGGTGRVGWSTPTLLVPPPADRPAPNRAKNVIVLLIDTLRADRTQPHNPRTRVQTPALLELGTQGAVFDACQTVENWTKPSVASLLTGMWPAGHGAKEQSSRLPDGAHLLSEVFRENGFATGAFIANGYVGARFGFNQGWDRYVNFITENRPTTAENLFDSAAEWVQQNRDRRFFLYVHTIDPHVPYSPPDRFLRMYDAREYTGIVDPRRTGDQLLGAKANPPTVVFDARDRERLEALYDGEISYHDHHLAQFLRQLREWNLLDETLIVVTSDHGEEFNDHGSYGHGHSLYQELLHVPLIMRYPGGIQAGTRITDSVGIVDVAATVLESAQVPVHRENEGRSLMPYLRGHAPSGPAVAFSDFLHDQRAVRAGRWKLRMRGLRADLFDLQADPNERRNVATDNPIAFRYTRTLLGQFLGAPTRRDWSRGGASEAATPAPLRSENAVIDQTTRQQLEALGYAHPAAPAAEGDAGH